MTTPDPARESDATANKVVLEGADFERRLHETLGLSGKRAHVVTLGYASYQKQLAAAEQRGIARGLEMARAVEPYKGMVMNAQTAGHTVAVVDTYRAAIAALIEEEAEL